MMNRITQSMMSTQFLRNLNSNLNQLNTYQNQMSTSRRINKPSDDPVGLSFAMRYRSDLGATEQYQENTSSAESWLDFTDASLGQTNDVMQRIRELAVQGASSSNPPTAMDAIKQEMIKLTEQLATIGNSSFNGKQIFNGQVTDLAPYAEGIVQDSTGKYVVNAKSSDTDNGAIQVDISTGTRVAVNLPGSQLYGASTDNDNVFAIMEDMINALHSNNSPGVSSLLGRLDTRMAKILAARADVGARINHIQLVDERLKDMNTNLQALQSKTEDADMAELITNLKTSENVYNASLSVGSKVLTPSLVDFLK